MKEQHHILILKLLITLSTYQMNLQTAIAQDPNNVAQAPQAQVQANQEENESLLKLNQKESAQLWQSFYADIAELAKERMKYDQLPNASVLHPFRADKESHIKKLHQISHALMMKIKTSDSKDFKDEYTVTNQEISELKQQIAELQEKQMLAPDPTGKITDYLKQTKADLQKKQETYKKQIDELEKQKDQLKKDAFLFLTQKGIKLSEEQTNQLFKLSSGDLMLDLYMIFGKLNLLGELCLDWMQKSNQAGYLENAQKYYATYVGIFYLLQELYTLTIERFNSEYIPKVNQTNASLTEIILNTKKLIDQQKKVASSDIGAEKMIEQLSQNLKTQEELLQAGQYYLHYIQGQISQLKELENNFKQQFLVVLNTYQTVSLSAEQLQSMENGLRDLSNLRKLTLPKMVGLNDEKIQKNLDLIYQHIDGNQDSVISKWQKR
jgi:hypothetical protein